MHLSSRAYLVVTLFLIFFMSKFNALPTTKTLVGSHPADILKTVVSALYPEEPSMNKFEIKECSGQSGAKTFIIKKDEIPNCVVKVSSGGSGIIDSDPLSQKRIKAASSIFREFNIAPKELMKGPDFHVESCAGVPSMKDFFHFQDSVKASDLGALLAKIHNTPPEWSAPIQAEALEKHPHLASILKRAPPYAPCWNQAFSGYETGMVILGAGNPNPDTAREILRLMVETGVYEKVMLCEAFMPTSAACRRIVTTHGDFKPDNILLNMDSGEPCVIDYDLSQAGSAINDFGFACCIWMNSRWTSAEFRQEFVTTYLEKSGLPSDAAAIRETLFDCEIGTICAVPGLLAHVYDAEVPLLRGIQHPTCKAGTMAGGPNDTPTGLEIVDLLEEAVRKIRADDSLIDRCIKDGFVKTIFETDGLGSDKLASWMKQMQKNNMLRLFGIAPE